jgi:hypothetical protein
MARSIIMMMTRAEIIMCLFECDCATSKNMELTQSSFWKACRTSRDRSNLLYEFGRNLIVRSFTLMMEAVGSYNLSRLGIQT